MKTLAALLLSLTLTAPAFAVPYSYEFLTGGLTGHFVAEAEIITTPGTYAFQSWSITPPLGPVWTSTDPNGSQFENFNNGPEMNLVLTTQEHPNGNPMLAVKIVNLGELAPNTVSGPYTWQLQLGNLGLTTTGSGTWARETQSVPVPGMVWPTAAGLVGMAWIMAKRRTHAA